MTRMMFYLATLLGLVIVVLVSDQKERKQFHGLSWTIPGEVSNDTAAILLQSNFKWLALESVDDRIINESAEAAHEHELKVLLTSSQPPALDTNRTKRYRDFENHLIQGAKLAERSNIEAFNIGIGVHHYLTAEEWRSIIQEIRKNYGGSITNTATIQELTHISIWRDLDFISVSLRFNQTVQQNPTRLELEASWTSSLRTIEKVAHNFLKRVVIFEEAAPALTDKHAQFAQRIFISVMWKQEWIDGLYLCRWDGRKINVSRL